MYKIIFCLLNKMLHNKMNLIFTMLQKKLNKLKIKKIL